jgi:outer membrane protein assembly factor BamB
MQRIFFFLLLPVILVTCLAAAPTGWRNDGSGHFPSANPPTQWNAEKMQGILWTADVGKSLYNSPVVVGEKVFTLAEPDVLTCLDAATGKQLWSKPTTVDDLPDKERSIALVPTMEEVGHTTPTPVSDGKNIYVAFADGLVTAFDLAGNRQWIVFIDEPCNTGNGRAASPCLSGDKLIVSMGTLTALDTKTGKTLWKAAKVNESYGSPIAGKFADFDIIVSPTGHVLNAADGSVLTQAPGETTYSTPLVAGDKVYFIDADSSAATLAKDTPKAKKIWQQDLDGEFFASPVLQDGVITIASNQGHLFALDAADGKILYDKELGIANMSGKPDLPPGNLYPSLCVAGKYLYVSNDQGDTVVIEAGREYKEVARNTLGETIAGSMAFSNNRLYVRTREKLYCIGQ